MGFQQDCGLSALPCGAVSNAATLSGPAPPIQAKLKVGAVNDPLEREADRIAEAVLAAPARPAVGAAPAQRIPSQPVTDLTSIDQSLTGPGESLEPALQQEMEHRFGHDSSRVRVHSGAAAEHSTRRLNANAYTVGNNIVFGAGQFAPNTFKGRWLLAHELTHAVQQSGADGGNSNKPRDALPISKSAITIQRDTPRIRRSSRAAIGRRLQAAVRL